MKAPGQYDVHEAEAHFDRILHQVENGQEVVISRAGEPVAKVVPLRPQVSRTDRGALPGQIRVPDGPQPLSP